MVERVSNGTAPPLEGALMRLAALRGLSAVRDGIVEELRALLGGGPIVVLLPGDALPAVPGTAGEESPGEPRPVHWPLDRESLMARIGVDRLPEAPGPWMLLELAAGGETAGLLVACPDRAPGPETLEALRAFASCAGLALALARLQRRFEARGDRLVGVQERLTRAEQTSLAAHHLRTAAGLLPGFAHELNNPLTALGGYAGMLAALPAEALAENREYLDRIQEQAMRCTLLVGRLMAFLRWERAESQVVGLRAAVDEALALAAHPLRKACVKVDLQLHGDPLLQGVPAGHLVQVLIDLVTNALAAMTDGEDRRLTLSSSAGPDCVHLVVEDSGGGVPRKDRGRIFEKFFTTRASEGATGLGLPSCIELLEEVGGCVSLETSDGSGTRVTLTLPVAEPGPDASGATG